MPMHAHDVFVGIRTLLRHRAFSLTAITLLALAAAANATVFSVVRGVLLKPLSYSQPDRLVAFWPNTFVSNEELTYWRERTRSFEHIAAISPGWLMALLADGHEPLKVTAGRTSDNFFTTLGVHAALGRTLMPGDSTPGKTRVVTISADIHQRHFKSDPRVIGRHVRLDGAVHQIVGVMPAGFEFMEPGTDVWAPLALDPTAPQHKAQFSQAFARLAPAISERAAAEELVALLPNMRRDLAKPGNWGREIHVASLQRAVTGEVRPTLLILLAAVGLILILAAVNLGTLVLGRSIARAREMAVRVSLGASAGRLAWQLITEQGMLAAAGASVGLSVAYLALPIVVRYIPPDMPRQADISLDLAVFAIVVAACVALSILLALVPIAIASRPELQPLLRQHQSTDTPTRRRTLDALVTAQIALAVVLGIGAGLMLRSLWNLQHVNPGFDAEHVLSFRLQTTSTHSAFTTGLPYFEQVIARVRALPGVAQVGSIQHLPMTGYNWTSQVYRPERPPAPGAEPPTVTWRFVGWDYFAAMGIPVREGRVFGLHDHAQAPAVAIVNEAMARREFGGAPAALGQLMVVVSGSGKEIVEIVGVTADVRFRSLNAAAEPEIYRPLAQTFMFPMAFVVRTTGDPAQLAAAVRQAAHDVDRAIPVAELQPLTSLIAGSLGRPRLLTMLLTVFAASGLALCVIGVYGVVAYRVRQRAPEFAIRVALGAAPARIRAGVLRHGVAYAVAGLLVGLPVAVALTHLMQSVVFGITPRDPLTFIALPTVVVLATLAACAIPAARASRMNPVTSRTD